MIELTAARLRKFFKTLVAFNNGDTMQRVFLLAKTELATDFTTFMTQVGAEDWGEPNVSNGDRLVEVCGRLCYASWKAFDGTDKTNPNVTKVRKGNKNYILNIIRSGHGSVFEHVNYTFALMGVSRVLTHELVRHRAGCAYSQASLRYIRLQEFNLVLPDQPGVTPQAKARMLRVRDNLRHEIKELNRELIEESPNQSFAHKKAMTSYIRRIAPIGIETNIIFTANARAIRHMIMMRTSKHAEVEIRDAFRYIAEVCECETPNLFQDMKENTDGEYTFPFYKVVCKNCDHETLDITPENVCLQCECDNVVVSVEQRGKL